MKDSLSSGKRTKSPLISGVDMGEEKLLQTLW